MLRGMPSKPFTIRLNFLKTFVDSSENKAAYAFIKLVPKCCQVFCLSGEFSKRRSMGRGQELTAEQIDLIKVYKDEGKSERYIAKKIGKSKTAVHNYLSALDVSVQIGSEASPRIIRRFLQRSPHIETTKTKNKSSIPGKMVKRKHRRSCCVPRCGTTSEELGLSFHEFPSDSGRRSQWLHNIWRHDSDFVLTDWTQRVCGLHFADDCFKRSAGRSVFLFREAIPTIFPSATMKADGSDAATHKPPSIPPLDCGTAPQALLDPANSRNPEAVQDPLPDRTVQSLAEAPQKRSSQASQSEVQPTPQQSAQTLVHLRKQVRCLQGEVLGLKQKYTLCRQLVKLEDEAKEDSEPALLLLEQLQAFNNRHHCWSGRMLRKCIRWRARTGYSSQDVVQKEILSLPCKTTLWRYRACVKLDP